MLCRLLISFIDIILSFFLYVEADDAYGASRYDLWYKDE